MTGRQTPAGHTATEQRRGERRQRNSYAQPDSRSHAERRVHPALGEFAIGEAHQLRERVKVLEAALEAFLDLCPRMLVLSDDDPIAPAIAGACRVARVALTHP